MDTFIRILLSVFTLITVLAALYLAIVGIIIHQPLLVVVGLALTAGFGIFVYADIKYWWAKLNPKPPVAK